jgi:hypothetical protein
MNQRQQSPCVLLRAVLPGDRVFVEGYADGTPDEELNPKKKIWEKIKVKSLCRQSFALAVT